MKKFCIIFLLLLLAGNLSAQQLDELENKTLGRLFVALQDYLKGPSLVGDEVTDYDYSQYLAHRELFVGKGSEFYASWDPDTIKRNVTVYAMSSLSPNSQHEYAREVTQCLWYDLGRLELEAVDVIYIDSIQKNSDGSKDAFGIWKFKYVKRKKENELTFGEGEDISRRFKLYNVDENVYLKRILFGNIYVSYNSKNK